LQYPNSQSMALMMLILLLL